MSKLVFDGSAHQISLMNSDGKVINTWPAYNNVDSHANLTHIQNRSYTVQDSLMSHRHASNANGAYGSYGIIRFDVPGHPGIGVHSGRADAKHLPGPQHPTMGCIRTSDGAMLAISNFMQTSPLTTIEVINNNASHAKLATHRNQHRQLNELHPA